MLFLGNGSWEKNPSRTTLSSSLTGPTRWCPPGRRWGPRWASCLICPTGASPPSRRPGPGIPSQSSTPRGSRASSQPVSIEYLRKLSILTWEPAGHIARKERLLLQCPEDPKIDILFYKIRFPSNRSGSKVQVNAAKLRLYKLGRGRESKLRITVFWLKLRNSGISPATQVMLDSVMEDGASEGWVSLDVTGAVSDWLKHQHRPMALMIRVEDDRQRELFSRSVMQTLTCDNGNDSQQKIGIID